MLPYTICISAVPRYMHVYRISKFSRSVNAFGMYLHNFAHCTEIGVKETACTAIQASDCI